MITLNQLDDQVFVAPQLRLDQIASLAGDGFSAVINHRPDGEEPGQPEHQSIAAALSDAEIENAYLPVQGLPGDDVIEASAALLARASGSKALFFCRSGFRSAVVWALIRRRQGWDADDLRARAAAAGYDLSRLPL
jgi:uncharacterized protein (TIGR01244 family)